MPGETETTTTATATETPSTPPAPTAALEVDPRLSSLIAAGEARKAARTKGATSTAAPTSSAPASTSTTATEAPAGSPTPPPTVTEETTPPGSDPAVATSWDELNRRDSSLKSREAGIKQRERDLATYDQIASARGNPLGLLQALGYSRNQILDAVIEQGDQQGQQPQIDPRRFVPREEVEAKVNAVKAELREQSRIRSAILSSDSELVRLATEDPDRGDAVIEEILLEAADEYNRTKQRPDYAEIIKRKEAAFERQTFGLIEMLNRSTKVKERYGFAGPKTTPPGNSTPPPPGTSATPTQQATTTPPATLSNDMQTEPPAHSDKKLSTEEKRTRFLEIISAGWKKGPGQK